MMCANRNASLGQLTGFSAALVFVTILQFVDSSSICAAEEPGTPPEHSASVAEIAAEWSNREGQFKTVQLNWHIVRDPQPTSNTYQVVFPVNEAGQTTAAAESFWLSDQNLCYEASRWYTELDAEFRDFDKEYLFAKYVHAMRRDEDDTRIWDRLPYRFKMVWNPAAHRELLSGAKDLAPLGTIRNSADSLVLNSNDQISTSVMFWPALMALRPALALGITPSNQNLVAKPELSRIGSRDGVVVEGQSRVGLTFRLWVVPAEGFSVVRAVFYANGRTRQQFDIDYIRKPESGWLPAAWKIMVFNPSDDYPGQAEVFPSVQIKVGRHAINDPVEGNPFQLDFPSGTLVNDATSSKTYVTLAGNSLRPATPDEVRVLFGKFEPKQVKSAVHIVSKNNLIIAGLIVSVGLLWGLRRRRKIRSQ